MTAPADEDVLTFPAAWRRHLHPRRGGAPGPAVGPNAAKEAAGLLDEAAGALESLLAARHGDLPRTEAARRHLDGTADTVGAAAVAAVTATAVQKGRDEAAVYSAFARHWAAEHGPAFAACAVLELARTAVVRTKGGSWRGVWLGTARRKRVDEAAAVALPAVRALLAAAGDEEYGEAVRLLARHRRSPTQCWLVSYLLPTEREWVDECVASGLGHMDGFQDLKLCTLGDAAQLDALQVGRSALSREVLVTLADAVGADLLPFLVRILGDRRLSSRDGGLVLETIAVLPSDEAFRVLLDRPDRHARTALVAAMERYPARALRLLAAAGTADARRLLETHARTRPDTVAAALPALPADVRATVETLMASSTGEAPEASPDKLPAFLADPPWDRPVRPVVTGLKAPAALAMAWRDGERAEWPATATDGIDRPVGADWKARAARYRGGARVRADVSLLVHGPEEVVRPLLADWKGVWVGEYGWEWMRVVVARYGTDALTPALLMAEQAPGSTLPLPFTGSTMALCMGEWLARSAKHAGPARDWLERHGLDAVQYLAPAALGTKAKPRRAAERALRRLADRHGVDAVADAVPEAAEELRAVLSAHPLRTGLGRRPKIPDWADPAVLPQLLLRDGETALPADATRTLVELLALPVPYRTDEIRAAFDPGSLREFGWTLLERWLAAGGRATHGWALEQLARTGDGESARRLVPLITAWPGRNRHAMADKGVDVLVALGSDAALHAVHCIAATAKSEGLRAGAAARFAAAAAERGLAPGRLADRIVPDFGLDADASMLLDFGPRRFRVGFDEQLRPYVADADGKPRKTLPKPAAKDDPALATAAHAAFTELKKDVRTAVSVRCRDLEEAMVAGRRWTPGEFRDLIVGHSIVGRLARRLVWFADATAFRVAEDGTFADVRDDPFVPPEDAAVGVAHPLHLAADLAAWTNVFADYEILQPFRQLDRPAVRLTEDERGGDRLERFEGLRLPARDVLRALDLTPWRFDAEGLAYDGCAWWPVGDGQRIVVGFRPGPWQDWEDWDEVEGTMTVEYLRATTAPEGEETYEGDPIRFGELNAVAVSEVLAALTGGSS